MDLKEIGKVDPDNFWYYLYKGQFIFDKAIKSFKLTILKKAKQPVTIKAIKQKKI